MKEIIIGYNEHEPGSPDPLWIAWEQTGELVRCKDCKHWDSDDHECNIKTGWFACGADWYCADGELKE